MTHPFSIQGIFDDEIFQLKIFIGGEPKPSALGERMSWSFTAIARHTENTSFVDDRNSIKLYQVKVFQ